MTARSVSHSSRSRTVPPGPAPGRRRAAWALALAALAAAAPAADAGPKVRYTDVSAAAGLDPDLFTSPTQHSLGVNWIDFDNDGWPDLFAVNGIAQSACLYHNNGRGGFVKVNQLLPALPSYDMTGSVFADYDNDGDPDIYIYTDNEDFSITGDNAPDGPPNLLLKNLWAENGGHLVPGQPLFQEVAAAAGVDDLAEQPGNRYPGMRAKTAGWLDYDRDGCIDLFVGHMVLQAEGQTSNRDRLYRNRCNGTFEDVTERSGLYPPVDPESAYRPTLAFISGYLNEDLWPDLYLVHVSSGLPGHDDQAHVDTVYFNQHNGTFQQMDFPGVGDDTQAGMGIDLADLDLDGDLDVYISDQKHHEYELETPPFGNALYLNESNQGLADNSAELAGVSGVTSWPTSFIDFDRDGYEDLFLGTSGNAKGRPVFFRNQGDGTFALMPSPIQVSTGDLRGAAFADYDRDGDQDLATVSEGGHLRLFRNDSTGLGNWIEIELVARRSNRTAIGTLVRVWADGRQLRREVHGGNSAHSQSSNVLHFSLGASTAVDRVVVYWPNGQVQFVPARDVNRFYRVSEP